MKNLIETTTGAISSQMILNHCGDYDGKFSDTAFDIFESIWGAPSSLGENQWMDIMHDKSGKVYAIWAEDALTCSNAWCYYVELDEGDCPEAFANMREKMNN